MGQLGVMLPPMANGPLFSTTYSIPFYCLGWVPLDHISPSSAAAADDSTSSTAAAEETSPPAGSQLMLVLGGGGGEGRHGIENRLLLSQFDFDSLSLSDQPVGYVETGEDLPYRMAVHPGGGGVVCSFLNSDSCRLFEWELPGTRGYKLELKAAKRTLGGLKGVGLQLALAFSADGSMLAAGGDDGHLRVFKWPHMEIILDIADVHPTVKDLDFSSGAKFLVSLGSSGPCRVWDLESLAIAANLPRENGEDFRFCRFSQNKENKQILYVITMHGYQGRIACWDCPSWKRVWTATIVRDSISSFNVSMDGQFLAVGTANGDVVVVNSDMHGPKVIKKAHLGIVTVVGFSKDSRALVSASVDSTVRVSLLDGTKRHGLKMWQILLVIALAIPVYLSWGRRRSTR